MGQFEERYRISLFLPNNNAEQAVAISGIISAATARFGGGTHSAENLPVFRGYWKEGNQIIRDNIVLLIADAPMPSGDLPTFLANLKREVKQEYEIVGQPQEEMWITAEQIHLVTG
mgnify:CR=1 FL=1